MSGKILNKMGYETAFAIIILGIFGLKVFISYSSKKRGT